MSAAAKTRKKRNRGAERQRNTVLKGAPRYWQPTTDIGTPELRNHYKIGHRETPQAGQTGVKVLNQRRIDWLHDKGQITDRQWSAAEKLLTDFHASKHQANTTGAYEGAQNAAKGRKHGKRPSEPMPSDRPFMWFMAALRSLGYTWSRFVRAVVIEDRPAGEATRAMSIHQHPVEATRYALDALADYYHAAGVNGFERDVI